MKIWVTYFLGYGLYLIGLFIVSIYLAMVLDFYLG